MTEEKINKIKKELKWNDNNEALSLIDFLEKQNEKLRKDNESYEQIFWDKDNEIATLKKKLDRLKNKGVRNDKRQRKRFPAISAGNGRRKDNTEN